MNLIVVRYTLRQDFKHGIEKGATEVFSRRIYLSIFFNFMNQPDPMLSILEWLGEQLMEAEVLVQLSAGKSEAHSIGLIHSAKSALYTALQMIYFQLISERLLSRSHPEQ